MNYPDGFFQWLRDNKRVYAEFVRLAKRMQMTGRKRYGAKSLVEVLRWHTNIRQGGEPEFKINNNYTSGLARLAMERNPDLRGFFSCRDMGR